MLDHGHLDFLIVNRASDRPEFAVEFDGPAHLERRQAERDRVKDELCLRADLPILRIGSDEIAPREQCSLLEWLIERFIAYRRVCPVRHHRDGTTWVPYPEWEFELEHTMPAVSSVIGRLHDEFGIVAGNWWAWGGDRACLAPSDTAMLLVVPEVSYLDSLGLLPEDMSNPDIRWFYETGEARVDLVRRDQDAPVFRARGRVVITERAWTHGGMLDSLFGFSYEEAQACLAEYLALRDVERYAMRHLVKRAA
jgi:hypothetical protein